MIKLEHTVTASPEQMEFIIEGMRNPMNSWEKSDSRECIENCDDCDNFLICQSAIDEPYFKRFYEGGPIDTNFCVGPNDFDLMTRLRNAGTDHRKFMRQMPVYVRITAPLYWWKEFDTYKVGTVSNSCSTMHKIHSKEFTLDDFSTNNLNTVSQVQLGCIIDYLNCCRVLYNNWDTIDDNTKNAWQVHDKKDIWWQMIQLLPTSYNQTRNISMNYEVLANIYHSRKAHKLDEWREFCKWIETLPLSELITGKENKYE